MDKQRHRLSAAEHAAAMEQTVAAVKSRTVYIDKASAAGKMDRVKNHVGTIAKAPMVDGLSASSKSALELLLAKWK